MTIPRTTLFAFLIILLVALMAGGGRWYLAETSLQKATNDLQVASSTLASLSGELAKAQAENRTLEDAFTAEKARNDAFASQIEEISGTVGVLDKLSKTDPELLQKYSKVYFLNENYVPSDLAEIPQEFMHDSDDEFFHAKALPLLERLMEDAKDDGIDLSITSAYRSFDTQKALKSGYTVRYGSGANAFSADQGYSEHQLGTTLDFSTAENGYGLTTAFDATAAYAWLDEHAYRYGFVLSYPKGNAYYQYEPWHWRYVGTDLARDLKEDGKHFYDLDQRTIDTYLVELFD